MKEIEEGSALYRVSGMRAAMSAGPGGEARLLWICVGGQEPDAAAAGRLHAAAMSVPDATVLVARSRDRTAIASRDGGIFAEGVSSMNIGLALRSLSADASATLFPAPSDPAFGPPQRRVFWDLIALFGRIETPRTLRFRMKTGDVVIAAARAGLRVLDGADDLNGFAEAVRTACGRAQPLHYTLDDAPVDAGASEGPTALLREIDQGDVLRLDSDGWPVALPIHLGFAELASAIRLVSALDAWGAAGSDPATWMQLRGPERGVIAEGRADKAGWVMDWAEPAPKAKTKGVT